MSIGLQAAEMAVRAMSAWTTYVPARVYRAALCAPHAFVRAQDGATAVEFALVALPFLALAGATLEAGVTYFGQEILQQATTDAGRQIYTGQFQTANVAVADTGRLLSNFRTALCFPGGRARITTFPCANVRISITKAASFGSATPVQATVINPITGASDWNPNFPSYTCARANDVTLLIAGAPGQLMRPGRAIVTGIGAAFAPFADGLGGDAVALGQHPGAFGRAGDLGADNRSGAGLGMDGKHQRALLADRRRTPSNRQA